jgi:ribonuclease G
MDNSSDIKDQPQPPVEQTHAEPPHTEAPHPEASHPPEEPQRDKKETLDYGGEEDALEHKHDVIEEIPEDEYQEAAAEAAEMIGTPEIGDSGTGILESSTDGAAPEIDQEPPGLGEKTVRPDPSRGRHDRHDRHGRPGQRQGHDRDRNRDRDRDRDQDRRGPRLEQPRRDKNTKNEILVNCSPEETRVGLVEDNQLIELLIDRTESEKIVGNIYKGRVDNVLPGISSAFVNVGLEKNAYLYVSDVIPTGKRPNSPQIEKMIARNEIIMVQVAKEAIGTKGVKITMDLSLPGRFLVYMPLAQHVGVSKNIEDRKERERLRNIVASCAPEKGGVIIRTEAEGAEEVALKREMAYLIRLWEGIQKRYETSPVPSLVHRDLGLVFQTVRDIFTENTSIFLVDSRGEYRDLMEFLDSISPELKSRVKLYEGKTPLFQAFNIEAQIEKIRSARVDLPSGGYIIIQEAEGLCAIDVNTGKFTGKRSQEETVTATNVEAAKEVARQLRLRNIGGIIVIDFIDMRHARNRQKVMEALANYTRPDRAKIKILPITRLGLIEMTRERKRESLFALLGEACPQCHASGRVLSRDSMFIKLKREMMLLTHGRPGNAIKLFLSPSVAQYFQERHQRLETFIKHKLIIHADPHLPWEEYRILVE